ncbi:unnamed protein product [Arabidopsis halleri]
MRHGKWMFPSRKFLLSFLNQLYRIHGCLPLHFTLVYVLGLVKNESQGSKSVKLHLKCPS